MCTADFINKNKSLSSIYSGPFNINHFVALLLTFKYHNNGISYKKHKRYCIMYVKLPD